MCFSSFQSYLDFRHFDHQPSLDAGRRRPCFGMQTRNIFPFLISLSHKTLQMMRCSIPTSSVSFWHSSIEASTRCQKNEKPSIIFFVSKNVFSTFRILELLRTGFRVLPSNKEEPLARALAELGASSHGKKNPGEFGGEFHRSKVGPLLALPGTLVLTLVLVGV